MGRGMVALTSHDRELKAANDGVGFEVRHGAESTEKSLEVPRVGEERRGENKSRRRNRRQSAANTGNRQCMAPACHWPAAASRRPSRAGPPDSGLRQRRTDCRIPAPKGESRGTAMMRAAPCLTLRRSSSVRHSLPPISRSAGLYGPPFFSLCSSTSLVFILLLILPM